MKGSGFPDYPEPHTVSETRILKMTAYAIVGAPAFNGRECNGTDASPDYSGSRWFSDSIPWADVRGLVYRQDYPLDFRPRVDPYCYVFARVSYRAGITICPDCRAIQPTIIQYSNESIHPPILSPDILTNLTLAMIPRVSPDISGHPFWFPNKFLSAQEYATEILSRSYQVGWTALTKDFGERANISVEAYVPTSSVSVTKWRVWLWVALHAVSLLIGVLFFTLYPHPWVDAPNLAALLIDTEDFRRTKSWKRDPWEAGTEVPSGVLTLEEGGAGRWNRRLAYRPLEESSI
jgi:hypothetical protein